QDVVTDIHKNGGLPPDAIRELRNRLKNKFPGKTADNRSKSYDHNYRVIYGRIAKVTQDYSLKENRRLILAREETQEQRNAFLASTSGASEQFGHGYSPDELEEHLITKPNQDKVDDIRQKGGLSPDEVRALRGRLRAR